MVSSPSPPPAPDPAATAQAQGAENRETAIAQARLNQVNEYTPFGSSVYTPTGDEIDGIQQFERTTTLAPEQQDILNKQNAASGALYGLANDQVGRVSDAVSQPYSYDSLPAAPEADSEARQQVVDALYGQYTSRLDPRFEKDQTALQTSLANQGIGVGSDAYNSALESFGRTRNDAYTSALNQAVSSGGAEQSRLFGLEQSARQQAIQEQASLRNQPLNEVAALMGTAPGVTMPQFSAIPQTPIQPADITGPTALAYQGQMNAYNQGVGQQNALMGGLFGLGGSVLGGAAYSGALFSDRRVKTDIEKVGKLDNGLPVYSFRYKMGGPVQIGLMAQDVEKVHPEAVGSVAGVKTVDYGQAVA